MTIYSNPPNNWVTNDIPFKQAQANQELREKFLEIDTAFDAIVFVGARAYLSADQDNIPASTWTRVLLNNESYDEGGNFAANGFVVPADGFYQINILAFWEATDMTNDEATRCAIYVDPLGIAAAAIAQVSSTSRHVINMPAGESVSTILELAATDIVYMYVWSTEADNDLESGEAFTSMSINKVG